MSLFFFKQKAKLFVLLFFCFSFLLSFPSYLLAEDYGLDETVGAIDNGGRALTQQGSPEIIAGKLLGTILTWTGVIFLILIFVGGLTWMTAQGNEQQVQKAKDMIIAALLGLIIIMSAYAITAYIGQNLFG